MVTELDGRMLFQSHLYRIRVEKPNRLSPYLLLAALNSPVVKRQIRSKQFTQDIIDTLGGRIGEVRLPLPRDEARRTRVALASASLGVRFCWWVWRRPSWATRSVTPASSSLRCFIVRSPSATA